MRLGNLSFRLLPLSILPMRYSQATPSRALCSMLAFALLLFSQYAGAQQRNAQITEPARKGDSLNVLLSSVAKVDRDSAVIEIFRAASTQGLVELRISNAANPEDLARAFRIISSSAVSTVRNNQRELRAYVYSRKPGNRKMPAAKRESMLVTLTELRNSQVRKNVGARYGAVPTLQTKIALARIASQR